MTNFFFVSHVSLDVSPLSLIRLLSARVLLEERKLFVGMLPKTHVEEDVRKMFVEFGEIEEVNVLKDQSKCSRGRRQ